MKHHALWKKYLPIVIVAGLIPAVIILDNYFHITVAATVVLVIFLGLGLAAMSLWAYANREANDADWWNDDDVSGWHGY